jgi:hypothetical protein
MDVMDTFVFGRKKLCPALYVIYLIIVDLCDA